LIIACIGDISKLQLYIWSSYGLLAWIKKIFSLFSPLFFEVYDLGRLYPLLSSRLLWQRRLLSSRGRNEHVVFFNVDPCDVVLCSVQCRFLRRIDGAQRQSMTSVGEVTAKEGSAPSRNRTGDLLLMRRGWYHMQDHCLC
jgi:hypothetical protein